ncbi:hypothetical protein CEE69_12320 [Rhodopirellula bahusiensis]|uniref:Uncharacterized protein n=1 Tax=Rhodopirellula bahusiensis TaxID=2014065 RepID=A0A2G1W973_9BACT|nr:hypothetical protein CEE69_12320 [Rhodopirellula bahusiensis]
MLATGWLIPKNSGGVRAPQQRSLEPIATASSIERLIVEGFRFNSRSPKNVLGRTHRFDVHKNQTQAIKSGGDFSRIH